MPGVQFGQQIDMNGFKVTEVATGTAGTDAVNVDQLNGAIDAIEIPYGFVQTIGDGTNSTYTVTHNLNTEDVQIGVYELATKHDVFVDPVRTSVNAVTVTFGAPIASNSHRVTVLPVVPAP